MLRMIGLLLLASPVAAGPGVTFEVRLAAGMAPAGGGRVLVALSQGTSRISFTDAGPPGRPVFGTDVKAFTADTVVTLDGTATAFPKPLADLPAGEYSAQAIFAFNPDLNLSTAPGNYYCEPIKVTIDPAKGTVVKLILDKIYNTAPPVDTDTNKYLAIPSKLLSAFHGRPMVYRVGVVLPAKFDPAAAEPYGLILDIGGFGGRYSSARRGRSDPRFVRVVLDGAGPFGDPYQVNSANNGPYGDALVTEVIPELEKRFHCGGDRRRFTCGGSTGGWVSLALQVFYPDTFNGCWSQCPDGVDFRAFQLTDIYSDRNMYVNKFGFERAARRTIDGDTVYTVRHECQLERVLGRGGRWEMSGQQWASWNAVYGPKGADGLPVPLWNGETGAIDPAVAKQWERYDLRLILERDWAKLGPKLGGKIHVWVGDADDYFLNNAVYRLKAATGKFSDPPFDGTLLIEPRKGHGSGGWTGAEMLDAMAKRMK